MNKRTGRLLSLLLTLAMVLGMLPATAVATGAEGTPTFAYTSDAELVRLSNSYDGCPIVIWKGHIEATVDGSTVKLNSATEELLNKLRPVWKNADTGEEVEPGSDVTMGSTNKYYIGPATAGTYSFTLEYKADETATPVTVLPEKTVSIGTETFERITAHDQFQAGHGISYYYEQYRYAIVGEAEGKLYAMSMNGGAAIEVTPDGEGHITLGSEPALVFTPYH